MYTSRQLLDPNQIMSFYNKRDEAVQKGWESLGNLAQYIGDKVEEQNRKDYLAQDRNVNNLEDLPEWQDPQFRAAAYSFMKGDRSGIDNYYQTKALNEAREAEALKAKEEKIRSLDNLEDAIANSDDWNTTANLYEKAIQKANELGDVDRMNRLKQEYDNVSKTEAMWKAQKPTNPTVEEMEQKKKEQEINVHKELEYRAKNLPVNREERNAEIDKLNKLVSDYEITDIVIPSKSTKPTRKEVLDQLNSNKIGYSAAKKLYKDIKLNKTTRRYE